MRCVVEWIGLGSWLLRAVTKQGCFVFSRFTTSTTRKPGQKILALNLPIIILELLKECLSYVVLLLLWEVDWASCVDILARKLSFFSSSLCTWDSASTSDCFVLANCWWRLWFSVASACIFWCSASKLRRVGRGGGSQEDQHETDLALITNNSYKIVPEENTLGHMQHIYYDHTSIHTIPHIHVYCTTRTYTGTAA